MLSTIYHVAINKAFRDKMNEEFLIKEHAVCQSKSSLNGKTVIVTGGNSGIGFESCKEFVKRGARVILACRNKTKGAKAKLEIEQETGVYGNLIVMIVNLASLQSVRNFADEFKKNEKRLDILLNNAGLLKTNPNYTEDGHEAIMATNHLGHFLLTYLLIDMLKKSAPSRIVNVSSLGHLVCTDMLFDDFNVKNRCCGLSQIYAYARSKAANVLFTRELGKRFSKDGITSYSCHPGSVTTDFANKLSPITDFPSYALQKLYLKDNSFQKSPKQGAQTLIYCCIQENIESESGSYYAECKKAEMSKLCKNEKNSKTLWDISCEFVGIKW